MRSNRWGSIIVLLLKPNVKCKACSFSTDPKTKIFQRDPCFFAAMKRPVATCSMCRVIMHLFNHFSNNTYFCINNMLHLCSE